MKARRARLGQRPPNENPQTSSPLMSPSPSKSPLKFRPRDFLFVHIIASAINVPFHDLPEKYGVQNLAPRGRRHEDEGEPFLLGSGASAFVVQHETDEKTAEITPKGSIVALKIYRHDDLDRAPTQSPSSQSIVQAIWQDIRVLCHPLLRSHENLCKLLYVAWDSFSLVPILALELAAFGTLQDALRSESGLEWLEKCNISMDVVIGLDVLHSCGFVHGDLKTSNIMLQSHSERTLVAKLLDFSGTTDMANYGTAGHTAFMTMLWLAPEIILGTQSPDWQKADVYALGLVLGQMWQREDLDLMELFLEAKLPKQLVASERKDMLLYYKCCADDEEMSTMNQALRSVSKHSHDPLDKVQSILLDQLLEGTLRANPSDRFNIRNLLVYFEIFARSNGRILPDPIDRNAAWEAEIEYWAGASQHDFFLLTIQIFTPQFEERDADHQKLCLRYMVDAAGPPELGKTVLRAGMDADYAEPERLQRLIASNIDASNRAGHADTDLYYTRCLHFQIAMCLLRGIGARMDEVLALRYLASAALGGLKRAISMFCSIEDSCAHRLVLDLPRRLFLVLGHFTGSLEASDYLRRWSSQTYLVAQEAAKLQEEHVRQTLNQYEPSIEPPLEVVEEIIDSVDKIVFSGDLDLFTAIAAEDFEALESLLRRDSDTEVLSHAGLTPLHAVALIADNVAAKMASLLIARGAHIDVDASEPMGSWKNRKSLGLGDPLAWAIIKDRSLLATVLIEKWAEGEGPIDGVSFKTATSLLLMARFQRHAMIEALTHYHSICERTKQETFDVLLARALTLSVERSDHDTIGGRWSLGSHFHTEREATTRRLLILGADPLCKEIDLNSMPFRKAILRGDIVSLKLYIQHVCPTREKALELLGRMGVLRSGRSGPIYWTALFGSLEAPCRNVFRYLLQEYPELIEQSSVSGRTPLHSAACHGDLIATKELLVKGAKVSAFTHQGATPFVDALCHNNRDIATLLAQHAPAEILYGHTSMNGLSAFGIVLHTYESGRRHIEVENFQLLLDLGGLPFITDSKNPRQQESCFRCLLRKGRPSHHDHIRSDMRLLRFFLRDDTFLDKIDVFDWTGRTALHYAAGAVYLEAVKILLDKGAGINAESLPMEAFEDIPGTKGGWTAFDWAVRQKLDGAPDRIKSGGSCEIREWQDRLTTLLRLIIERGGKPGEKAPMVHHLTLWKIRDPRKLRTIFVTSAVRNTPGDETWQGKWPKPIPRTKAFSSTTGQTPAWPTSRTLIGPQRVASSDKIRDIKARDDNRQIVYRTSKGKKHIVPEIVLDLSGAMMDSSSSEGDEGIKVATRQTLLDAQKFNASKIAEYTARGS